MKITSGTPAAGIHAKQNVKTSNMPHHRTMDNSTTIINWLISVKLDEYINQLLYILLLFNSLLLAPVWQSC
jgi:hypothetical protein